LKSSKQTKDKSLHIICLSLLDTMEWRRTGSEGRMFSVKWKLKITKMQHILKFRFLHLAWQALPTACCMKSTCRNAWGPPSVGGTGLCLPLVKEISVNTNAIFSLYFIKISFIECSNCNNWTADSGQGEVLLNEKCKNLWKVMGFTRNETSGSSVIPCETKYACIMMFNLRNQFTGSGMQYKLSCRRAMLKIAEWFSLQCIWAKN
jgi:hypothetical protein